jgi:hypothetical protein
MNKKYEFLCAQQHDGTRTWWSQHSTSQQTPIISAYCEYPCGLGRQCTSPGGVLLDSENPIRGSLEEAKRIFSTCDSGIGPSVPEGKLTSGEKSVLFCFVFEITLWMLRYPCLWCYCFKIKSSLTLFKIK